jgi:hypothetical protein
MNQEKGPLAVSATFINLLAIVLAVAIVAYFAVQPPPVHRVDPQRVEITHLVLALENFRTSVGKGDYPPSSNDDPEEMRRFLAKAFPKYHSGLPEKYKNLDPASSLVFWLGGVTDSNGKLIGFCADPANPFDETNPNRIPACLEFDQKRLRSKNGLLVYFPEIMNEKCDPFVYFRPDSTGEYHGESHNCRACRDSKTGEWINAKTYQLFGPGKDGKYGAGVQYPSGADYDENRKDDMSNFTQGATLGNDM